jgi:trehalose-6-phosphatase
MWLAAEHGMFLRLTKGEWMTTMPEHLNMEWVDSVKVCAEIVFLFNFLQTQNL